MILRPMTFPRRCEMFAALLIFACASTCCLQAQVASPAQDSPAAGAPDTFPVKCDCGGFRLRDGRLSIINGNIHFEASEARDSKYSFTMPASGVKKIMKPYGFRHCMFGLGFKSGGFRRFIAFDGAGKRTNAEPIMAAVKQAIGNEVATEEEAPPSPEPTADNLQPASYDGHPVQPSNVTIISLPPGADINVDGKFVGSTPSTVQLPPGEHLVSVESEGMTPWQRTVTLSAGGSITLSATLEKP